MIVILPEWETAMKTLKVDINDGRRILAVPEGTTLLKALESHDIFIPSACGGRAICGLCKVTILEGATAPILQRERFHLMDAEIEQNVRLSCQIGIANDLKIRIPEFLLNVRRFTAEVTDIDDLNHDTKRLCLRLVDPPQIQFKAGQFVQLYSLPYDDVRESVFRAYSIASPPYLSPVVELIIRLVPQGICSGYVHRALKIGDPVQFSGPFGEFYLCGEEKEMIMVAGGSGLAPMRAIILETLERRLDKNMTLFFGAVTGKDLYYVDFFEDLAQKCSNFRFIPALSKPDPEDAWNGETGLITDVVDRHIPGAIGRDVYLCGSPGMINACLKVLRQKGFSDDHIFYDKF
jgi:Na+-transporting NADH:ubiquinone oxidoreductase subunit F